MRACAHIHTHRHESWKQEERDLDFSFGDCCRSVSSQVSSGSIVQLQLTVLAKEKGVIDTEAFKGPNSRADLHSESWPVPVPY